MHEEYMRQALTIAAYGAGRTSPNPLVGAVIVHNSRIVGQGWHRKAGTPHAEIHALKQAETFAKGATMYVTLEPCAHYGRTPPCCQAIIDAGIKQVIIAILDPNPLVSGKGLEKLRDAGIEVITGVLEKEAYTLNEVFFKWITTKLPFVVLKTAMTLDGKIATSSGQSQWITSTASREYVHKMRDIYDSILVGIDTILADDPSLTMRLGEGGKNPIRIIVDSMARTPITAKVITDRLAPTIIAVTTNAPAVKVAALKAAGAEVITINIMAGQVNLHDLLICLSQKNITSVFVEGGATINYSFMKENLIDKVHVFVAPKLVGGKSAATPIGGVGIKNLSEACRLEQMKPQMIGKDILISAYVKKKVN